MKKYGAMDAYRGVVPLRIMIEHYDSTFIHNDLETCRKVEFDKWDGGHDSYLAIVEHDTVTDKYYDVNWQGRRTDITDLKHPRY